MTRWLLLLGALLSIAGCEQDDEQEGIDFRQEMRNLVMEIASEARQSDPDFLIIPQNGIELVIQEMDGNDVAMNDYLEAVSGHGQEDLFYGYVSDDVVTPSDDTNYLKSLLDISRSVGNTILVTDYCSTPSHMDDAYSKNMASAYVGFAADHRELDNIPSYPTPIYGENDGVTLSLSQVQNFLYLINPAEYETRTAFVQAVTATNYDLIIMDLFFNDNSTFTQQEVDALHHKANGGSRLVICYMSIGEAEDYRYYWESGWSSNTPDWVAAENPAWEGNYKVRYWDSDWQDIILGAGDSYLDRILAAGFDGVYLDIIDAYEYFEGR